MSLSNNVMPFSDVFEMTDTTDDYNCLGRVTVQCTIQVTNIQMLMNMYLADFKTVPNNYQAQTYADVGVLSSLTLFFVSENTQRRCV